MAIDFDRLLKLRLVVARVGEMDNARWWNTKGQLSQLGAMALRRGLPRTHHFAQARSVFAVASARCAEVFDPPGCVTLWKLPPALQDSFDAKWERWLDQRETWGPFFTRLQGLRETNALAALQACDLISRDQEASVVKMRRSGDGRGVMVPLSGEIDDRYVTLLAAGFSKGEVGALAVPYGRTEE